MGAIAQTVLCYRQREILMYHTVTVGVAPVIGETRVAFVALSGVASSAPVT